MNSIKELKAIAQNFRVLYVEDELTIRTSMHAYLSKFFLDVVSVENGQKALDIYEKDKFDLIVLISQCQSSMVWICS